LRSGTRFDPKAVTVKSAEDLGRYEEMLHSEEDVSFSYIHMHRPFVAKWLLCVL
jgi:hypothetical protein